MNISPKINISAQPIKKIPSQVLDSSDAITRDSNISAQIPKKVIFQHEPPQKAIFLVKSGQIQIVNCDGRVNM